MSNQELSIRFIGVLFIKLLLLLACGKPDKNISELVPVASDSVVSVMDSIPTSIQVIQDSLEVLLSKATPILSSWGFNKIDDVTLDKRSDFSDHWWLKIFTVRSRHGDSTHFPKQSNYDRIRSIRQVTFEKSWKYILEDWTFESEKGAKDWIQIAVRTRDVDDQKPPRSYWRKGKHIYFVVATAAKDWFEHGDELVMTCSGYKPALLSLFNEPLDLVEYKVKKRGANSSVLTETDGYFKPDTVGHYISYFWFQQLRQKYQPNVLFSGLVINTYMYGETIQNYDDASEELVEIRSKGIQDPQLGLLDLVGKTRKEINSLFGMEAIGDLSTVRMNDDCLILNFTGDQVQWFRFIRSNMKSDSELPMAFTRYPE